MTLETSIAKIQSLSPSALKQVEDFVDFMMREGRALTHAASRLSENSVLRVWYNADDADYDRL